MARPTKLNADVQKRIEDAVRMGATYELAAQYGGVSYNTFNEWRKRGIAEVERVQENYRNKILKSELPFVEFNEAIQKAEGDAVVGWLAKIEKAANEGVWQAAAWKLERRYPGDYNRNRTEHTGKGGGAIEHQVALTWEDVMRRDDGSD